MFWGSHRSRHFREPRFYVADSELPGAGKGLFAAQDIPLNTKIIRTQLGEYTGDQVSVKDHRQRTNEENAYCMEVVDRDGTTLYHIDAKDCENTNCLRYINGIKDSGKTQNCEFAQCTETNKLYVNVWCYQKAIVKDTELLVNYGEKYWS
jgi:hypothetical protein